MYHIFMYTILYYCILLYIFIYNHAPVIWYSPPDRQFGGTTLLVQNGQAVSVKSDVSTLQKPTGVALGSGIVGILVEIYLLYTWVNYIYGGIIYIYIYTYGWNR